MKFFYRFYNNPDIGNFNNRAAVIALDNTSTTLPATNAPIVIDGVRILRNQRVLFTNLSDSTLNNRVYSLEISGGVLTWTVQKDRQRFLSGPEDGDILFVVQGVSNGQTLVGYDSDSNSWQPQRIDLDFNDDIGRDNDRPPRTDISWGSYKLMDLADGVNPNDAVNFYQLSTVGSSAIFRDNTQPPTTDISWDSHKLTDLTDGANPNDAINKGQLDSHESDTTNIHGIVDTSDLALKSNRLARTLHVSKGGNDSNSGSSFDPFLTINAAISAAKTLSPLPSFTNPVNIIVSPGEYNEQVLLDYAGINLYGFGQGVSRIVNAGTALRIEDNGIDPYPWDIKIVGFSIESTTSDYSVTVTGISGSSIAGSELQFRDCRLDGSNSIHINIANYIDFQNTYVPGAQLYEQTAGIWCEDSESAGSITVDWDNAGIKPASGSHYGIYFIRHLPRGSITLLNSGAIGEDLRPRPYALLPKAEVADVNKFLKVTGAESADWIAAVESFEGRTGPVTSQANDYTWAEIDKTISDIADITTKSHTNLSDIGTNSHSDIDNHIAASTSVHGIVDTSDLALQSGDLTQFSDYSHTLLTDIGTNSHANIDSHISDSSIHFSESNISHLNIQDIGTNSHSDIDTHISDSTIHYTESSISHLNIQDIGSNSHADIDFHIASTANPHLVSASQVGNTVAQWNADSLQGKTVPAPGASEDEKFLKYDHDTGACIWESLSPFEADPLSLHLDGSNSPSATISWAGYDINNLGNIKPKDNRVQTFGDLTHRWSSLWLGRNINLWSTIDSFTDVVFLRKDQDAETRVVVENSNTGASAIGSYRLQGSGWNASFSGNYSSDSAKLSTTSMANGLEIGPTDSAPLKFLISNTEVAQFNTSGDLVFQSGKKITLNTEDITETKVGNWDTAYNNTLNAENIFELPITAPVSGDDGEFLRYNYNGGSPTLTWEAAGGASVAGSDTQIQFNSSGSFGASSELVWDYTNKRFQLIASSGSSMSGRISAGSVYLDYGVLAPLYGTVGAVATTSAHALILAAGASGGTPRKHIRLNTDYSIDFFRNQAIIANFKASSGNLNLVTGHAFEINDIQVVGAQESAITSLTDSSGGSVDGTLSAVTDNLEMTNNTTINDNFAELNTKVDNILIALRNHGLIAT